MEKSNFIERETVKIITWEWVTPNTNNMNFKQYKRKGLSEMIPINEFVSNGGDMGKVSISNPDKALLTEVFTQGFIARNPKNHEDLWYVAKKYFDENLEEAEPKTANTETFMDRLVKERDELKDKLNKLNSFLDTGEQNVIAKVGQKQYDYLLKQYEFMSNYLLVLNFRIEDLGS